MLKGVECIEEELEELLSFYDFPKKHWSKIRRRIRSISCFENKRSCERIIYALVIYNNKKWEEKPLHEFTQKS